MKLLSTTLVVSALTIAIAGQEPAIRWTPTGGPMLGDQRQLIAQRGQLLLISSSGWRRSLDRGTTWERLPERTPRPWIVGANDRDLFGDAVDGVLRSSDMAESWVRCGALPVDRKIGHDVRSIAADASRVYVSILRVGLFRSDDRCSTWVQLAVPWDIGSSASIAEVDGERVIVRPGGRTFLSLDAGNAWAPLAGEMTGALTFAKACDGAILAGDARGVFVSRDGGRTWATIGMVGRWVPALAAPRCDTIFAAARDTGRWTYSVFRSSDGGATWTTVNDGLSGHPIADLSVDDQGDVFALARSGLFKWSPDGRWQPRGPTETPISSVVATPWGDVLAAAGWIGLFRNDDTTKSWRTLLLGHEAHVSMHGPAGDATAYVATVTPQGDLLAATQLWLLRSRDRGETWQRAGLTRTVHAFVSTTSGAILAGTDSGIFLSSDGGESWVEHSLGLSAFRIYSLAVAADGTVYAGTWDGPVFRSSDDGNRWRVMPRPPSGRPVHALLALKNGDLLAGTHAGLFRWEAAASRWQLISLTIESRPLVVRALVQDERGYLFAGTEGHGVFASFDEGVRWQAVNEGLSERRVFSLAVNARLQVLAGTAAGVFRATVDPLPPK